MVVAVVSSLASTPSLSSTPLVASSNSILRINFKRASNLSTNITASDTPTLSNRGTPSKASPAASNTIVSSTPQPSSQASSQSGTSLAHLTASGVGSAPPSLASTSSAKASPSSSLSSKSTSLSSTAHASSNSTPVSSKVSANSSSSVTLPQAVASKAANATSSIPTNVNASTTSHRFVPQVSTSDTLPSRSITPVSSPTSTLNNFTKTSGFFANRGAVAGVFVVVALAVLGLAAFLFFGLKRYCRRSSRDGSVGEPTLPQLHPSNHDDMHYRRASQMRTLGDVFSDRASRPLSGRSIASEDSNAFSRDTHRSTDPIMPPFRNRFSIQNSTSQGYAEEYHNLPPPIQPFASQSRASVQSNAESSPSIYPPTLPSVIDEEEENYWQRQGFERIVDPQESDKIVEKYATQQQPTPPTSMLGLWSNSSQLSQHCSSEENELVRNLDPLMEPTSVHKGSTAPIAIPQRLHLHDEQYFATAI